MPRKVDILRHKLVPQHILLSRDEAKRILRKLGLKKSELPWIYATDPAARALRAKPGDVIMVIRRSPTAGEAIAFRLVVKG